MPPEAVAVIDPFDAETICTDVGGLGVPTAVTELEEVAEEVGSCWSLLIATTVNCVVVA